MKTSDILKELLPRQEDILGHQLLGTRIELSQSLARQIVLHELNRAQAFLAITHGDVARAINLAEQEELR